MKKFHGLVVKLSRDDVDSLVSSSDDVGIFSCSENDEHLWPLLYDDSKT